MVIAIICIAIVMAIIECMAIYVHKTMHACILLCVAKQILGKDYQDLGDRQKQRRKQQIKKAVNSSLNSFQEIGLAPVSLALRSTDSSDEPFTIMLDGSKCTKDSHNDQHHDVIPSLAYLLLKYGVSQKFYHELSMSIPELPRSYKVYIVAWLYNKEQIICHKLCTNIYVYYL